MWWDFVGFWWEKLWDRPKLGFSCCSLKGATERTCELLWDEWGGAQDVNWSFSFMCWFSWSVDWTRVEKTNRTLLALTGQNHPVEHVRCDKLRKKAVAHLCHVEKNRRPSPQRVRRWGSGTPQWRRAWSLSDTHPGGWKGSGRPPPSAPSPAAPSCGLVDGQSINGRMKHQMQQK